MPINPEMKKYRELHDQMKKQQMKINNEDLLKVVEGIQKITGQDRPKSSKEEGTLNINFGTPASPVNPNTTVSDDNSSLSSEAAAKILQIIADEKRKIQNEKMVKDVLSFASEKEDIMVYGKEQWLKKLIFWNPNLPIKHLFLKNIQKNALLIG